MDTASLTELLLTSEERDLMQKSVQVLEEKNYSEFYQGNQDIVQSILFLENIDEFLDFSKENSLDTECFCFAFICAKGYGIQIGGYEDDLTQTLTTFFETKGIMYPEILDIIKKEKIYTDCSDYDNFKRAMTEINGVLSTQGKQLVIFEDFVYCDCEYTILLVENAVADRLISSWTSNNFEIYL